jgi:ribonuclease BN (tRNA processing enzyme)
MAQLQVIGSGEAFDSGLGNTSYLFTGKRLPTVLFDCGYQIPERLWAEDAHKTIDAICFTHLHADHAFGVVPLLARYWEEKRKRPLRILGPKGTATFLRKLFDLGYPGFMKKIGFTMEFEDLTEKEELNWRGLRFRVARTKHSVLNHTIRVDFAGGSFAISGDGRVKPEGWELVKDVGLLCQECYNKRAEIPVHEDLRTLEAFMARADVKVKRIGLAHLSRNEKAGILKRVALLSSKDPRWVVLKPGMRLELGNES